jgi:hypothetical protein
MGDPSISGLRRRSVTNGGRGQVAGEWAIRRDYFTSTKSVGFQEPLNAGSSGP